MNILSYNINEANTNNNIHKSNRIICPECKEDIFIKFNSYSISLSNCKNGHSINNKSIENFENIQVIDYSRIICNKCNKNRQDLYEYTFFKCLECGINLCPLCKNMHENDEITHKIIDYDKINYTCNVDKDVFIKYCHDYNKNLCLKCEKEHKSHKSIYFGDISPDDNIIINIIKKLKESSDKLSLDIQLIIERLSNIINNLKKYQEEFKDIIKPYNNNNKNYQVLQNINEFMKINNSIYKDINDIISNDDISYKLKNLINLYYKFNNKIQTVGSFQNHEKESINFNEIKEINSYTFDYDQHKLEHNGNEDYPALIIDNGSTYFRVGFAGYEGPHLQIPACIGYPKLENKKGFNKECLMGKDALDSREYLNLKYPINRGIIQDIDDLQNFYENIFKNRIIVDKTQHNVFITGVSVDLKNNYEQIGEMMFETFNVRGLFFVNQSLCSLYSYGKFDGLILDLSDSLTHLIAYEDGSSIKAAEKWYNIGGKDLTNYMQKLLSKDAGYDINLFDIKLIKENTCYCALNFDEEFKGFSDYYNYELPDSKIIVKKERILCPEVLFNPNLLYKEEKSLAQVCYDLLGKIESNRGLNFWDKINLAGGNSLMSNFSLRLSKELINLSKESKNLNNKIKIEEGSKERLCSPFIGGSILSSISTFQSKWITKTEYEETGMKEYETRKID